MGWKSAQLSWVYIQYSLHGFTVGNSDCTINCATVTYLTCHSGSLDILEYYLVSQDAVTFALVT